MELRGIPAFLLISWLAEVCGLTRVCYFTNWAQHRPGAGKFTPDNIDPYLCSHIVYAYAWLSGNHLTATQDNDEPSFGDIGQYAKVTQLKELNPELKVLLAVGGWNAGSLPFSNMVASNESRREFIQSAISYLRHHDFDGIDLDWEYPGRRRGRSTDKDNLNSLLIEMRQAFIEEANVTGSDVLLITAVVPPDKSFTETGYDVPVVSRMLDFLHVMTYDFHGSWESRVGHPSPMYPRPGEVGDDSLLNMESALNYWIQLGVPKKKLVASIALYGRTYTLLDSANHTVGSLDNGSGPAAPYTREPGFIAYYEICDLLNQGATRYWHDAYKVPYLVNGTTWIGYDDPDSIAIKMRRLKDLNIGGVMVWALDLDDFSGTFCNQGVSPLLTTVNLKLVDRKFNIENIPMGISAKHVNVSAMTFIDDILRNQSDSKHDTHVQSQLTAHVPDSVKQVADMIINAQAALEQSRRNTQKNRTDMLSEAKRVLLEKTGFWSALTTGTDGKDTLAAPTGTHTRTLLRQSNQQHAKEQIEFSHVPTDVISESVLMATKSNKRDFASSFRAIPPADKDSVTLNVLKKKTANLKGSGNVQHARTVLSNNLNEQLKINPRETKLQPLGTAGISGQYPFHRNALVEHKPIDEVSVMLSNLFDGSYSAESLKQTGGKILQTDYKHALDSTILTVPNALSMRHGMDGKSGKDVVSDAKTFKHSKNTFSLSSRNTTNNARLAVGSISKETGNVELVTKSSKIGGSPQFNRTYDNIINPTILDPFHTQSNNSSTLYGTDGKNYASDTAVMIRSFSDSSLPYRDIHDKTFIKDATKAGTLSINTENEPVISVPSVASDSASSTQLVNRTGWTTKAPLKITYSDGLKLQSTSTVDSTHIVKTAPRRAKLRVFERVKSGVFAPLLVQTVIPDSEQISLSNTVDTISSAGVSIKTNNPGGHVDEPVKHNFFQGNSKDVNSLKDNRKGAFTPGVDRNTLDSQSLFAMNSNNVNTLRDRQTNENSIITNTQIRATNKQLNDNIIAKSSDNVESLQNTHSAGLFIKTSTAGRHLNILIGNDIPKGNSPGASIEQNISSAGLLIDGHTSEGKTTVLRNNGILNEYDPNAKTSKSMPLADISTEHNTPGKKTNMILTGNNQSATVPHIISPAEIPIEAYTIEANANALVNNEIVTGNSPTADFPQSLSPTMVSGEAKRQGIATEALVNNDAQLSSTGILFKADTTKSNVNTLEDNNVSLSNSLKLKLIQSISSTGVSVEESTPGGNANTQVNNDILTRDNEIVKIQRSISSAGIPIKANASTGNANTQENIFLLTETNPNVNSPQSDLSAGISIEAIMPGRITNTNVNNANIIAENSPSANLQQNMSSTGLYSADNTPEGNANTAVNNGSLTVNIPSVDTQQSMSTGEISIDKNTPERNSNTQVNNDTFTENSPIANIPQNIIYQGGSFEANTLGRSMNIHVNNELPFGSSKQEPQIVPLSEVSITASIAGGNTDTRIKNTLPMKASTNRNNFVSRVPPITSQDIIIHFNIDKAKGRNLSKINKLDENRASALNSKVKLSESVDRVKTKAHINNLKTVNETELEMNTKDKNRKKDVPPEYHTGLTLKSKATVDSYRIIKVSPRRAKLRLRERVRAGVFAPTITQLDRQSQMQQKYYKLNDLGIKV